MPQIKKNDEVVVIAGKHKGTRGKVLKVLPKSDRVIVQGVQVVTRHVKPDRDNPQGGLVRQEAPIHISNVMVADPKDGKPTRVRIKTLESGQRVRVSVRSGEQLDT